MHTPFAFVPQVADYIEAQPGALLSGTPLRDWVRWDSDMALTAYAARMRTAGQWGGAIEISLCARLSGVDVHVYEPAGGASKAQFRRISTFSASPTEKASKIVSLLYGGRVHYDSLLLD